MSMSMPRWGSSARSGPMGIKVEPAIATTAAITAATTPMKAPRNAAVRTKSAASLAQRPQRGARFGFEPLLARCDLHDNGDARKCGQGREGPQREHVRPVRAVRGAGVCR